MNIQVRITLDLGLQNNCFNLFDGVIKTPSFDGGGVDSIIFICENNRKSNTIMHCVDLFFEW